jgi:PAS domain S-box-containing protein
MVVLVNSAAERMFGYARDELVGQSIDLLIPEQLRLRHHHHLTSYTTEPRLRPMGPHLDLHGRRRDGSEFPVEIGLSPFSAESGLLIIAGIRDVAERRQLEREKKQATAYLFSAMEAVQEAFLLFDENDRVLLVNSAARELMGPVGNAPITGRTFEELLRASILTTNPAPSGASPCPCGSRRASAGIRSCTSRTIHRTSRSCASSSRICQASSY